MFDFAGVPAGVVGAPNEKAVFGASAGVGVAGVDEPNENAVFV
jgi:hypothetical protein